ncbi:MAG: hypothetical protein ACYS0F_10000 [Planctomycetota bacterium]|jgi:hypothetical protein
MTKSHSVALVAVLVFAGFAHAQEVVDQQNDPTSTKSFSCGKTPILNKSILQSFVPAQDNLSAVEVRLRAGDSFPSTGQTVTIRVRDGATDGAVLGESSATVPANQEFLAQSVVRFEFSNVALTPGDTYFIELDTPSSGILTWMGADDVDHYPDGSAHTCAGTVWSGGITDFNFTTYAVVASSPCARIEKLASFVGDERCLQVMLRAACKHVKKERPGLAMIKLGIFQHKVRVLVYIGRMDPAKGKALIAEAHDIARELRAQLPKKRCSKKWMRRR